MMNSMPQQQQQNMPQNYYSQQPQMMQQQPGQMMQQNTMQQQPMMPGQGMQQNQMQQQPMMQQQNQYQQPQMMQQQQNNPYQQPGQMMQQQPGQMMQQQPNNNQYQPTLQQQQQQGNQNMRAAPQPQNMRQQQAQQQQARAQRSQMSRPPYVDPNTNIIYDTDNPEYEGFLTKQSMWLKDWRRRFFLLKGSKLFYCSNEYSTPHGMIDLAMCTTVKSADLKSRKRNSFEISTPEITYLLYADTEGEKDDWIGRVGKAIVRCSSTYHGSNKGPQQQGQQGRGGLYQGYGQNQQHSAIDSDDDDIYYEDPNNPMPYFND